MSKNHLDKIEKTQREKGLEICNQILELEDYTKHTEILSHLIGNDIANIINSTKTSKVVLNGPLFEIIPNFLPFYNVIFLTVCPGCKIVYEPSKLLPYLETALVVPVLTSSLSYYPIEFINLISSFQHIPNAYYDAMAWINLFVHEENNIGEHVCDHCFYGAYEEVVAELDKIRIAKKTKESIIDYILPKLLNPSVLNTGLLRSFSESIKSEGRKSVPQYSSILTGAGKLNESIIFSSVTSVDLRTYDLIGQVNTDLYTNSIGYMPVELVSETASRLGIAYSPKIPIKEYLKIISPHIGSCSEILSSSSDSLDCYRNTLDRVQDINIEVRKVANSKRRKVLEFSTSFIKENKSIFTSLLAGGTGFALGGMAGCGFGAVGGLLTAEGLKAIKKIPSINIPESSKKDIKELVMPITIDALSAYYRVSTEAVQVWQLKESMMKTTINRKVKS